MAVGVDALDGLLNERLRSLAAADPDALRTHDVGGEVLGFTLHMQKIGAKNYIKKN